MVAVVIILAVVAISLDDIPFTDNVGGGPLGLTLGLDLQGGSLLIYEAELPDNAQVEFERPVDEAVLRDLLDGPDLGQNRATTSQSAYSITGISIAEISESELRRKIEELGALDQLVLSNGSLEFTFAQAAPDATTSDAPAAPTEDDIRQVLDSLGYNSAILESTGESSYRAGGLEIGPRAQEQVRFALSQLSPLSSLEVSEDSADVVFEEKLARFAVQTSLNDIAPNALVNISAQTSYDLQDLTIPPEDRQRFEDALATLAPVTSLAVEIVEPTEEQMEGVKNIIEDRINALGTTEPIIQNLGTDRLVVQLPGAEASAVDLFFSPIPSAPDLENVLNSLGRTGDAINATAVNSFTIGASEALSSDEEGLLRGAVSLLGTLESFEVAGDRTEILVSYVLPPGPSVVAGILDEIGVVDFTLETPAANRIIIRVEDPLNNDLHEQLRTRLQSVAPGLTRYIAQGGFERAKGLIQQTAQLELKERTCQDVSCIDFVDSELGLTGRDLDRAFRGRDPTSNQPVVNLNFNSRGASIFRDLTTRIAGNDFKRIAIFLDQQEISSPVVQTPILDGRGIISGLTNEEARDLAIQLESGRLPVPLELIRENTVDALLGADSLRKSLIAGLIGLGLVLLFMVMYYRLAGLVAGISLLVYAVIILAVFKVTGITLILSGLAGLVLSIGMAVDANILIFERMKEEMRGGRTLTSAMEVGFRRAWRAIRDSNVSTILTCLILFLFGSRLGGGTPVVTGFAITLGLGVLVSMFTAYTVSRNLLQIMAWTPLGKLTPLFTPESRRRHTISTAGGGR